jgi:hypothetical protein
MAELQIVYWRDIPAQVIVRQGRKAARRELPKRFIEAVDMCAMRVGAKDSDAYLAEWRRESTQRETADIEGEAARAAAELDGAFDLERLRKLIANAGRET